MLPGQTLALSSPVATTTFADSAARIVAGGGARPVPNGGCATGPVADDAPEALVPAGGHAANPPANDVVNGRVVTGRDAARPAADNSVRHVLVHLAPPHMAVEDDALASKGAHGFIMYGISSPD